MAKQPEKANPQQPASRWLVGFIFFATTFALIFSFVYFRYINPAAPQGTLGIVVWVFDSFIIVPILLIMGYAGILMINKDFAIAFDKFFRVKELIRKEKKRNEISKKVMAKDGARIRKYINERFRNAKRV